MSVISFILFFLFSSLFFASSFAGLLLLNKLQKSDLALTLCSGTFLRLFASCFSLGLETSNVTTPALELDSLLKFLSRHFVRTFLLVLVLLSLSLSLSDEGYEITGGSNANLLSLSLFEIPSCS